MAKRSELHGRRAEPPQSGVREEPPERDPLLAELREDYSQWACVAPDVNPFRFWGSALGVRVSKMERAGLIRTGTEQVPGKWVRRSVWAIARTPAERCTCDGYGMSAGGPRDPQCPAHGHTPEDGPR